MRAAAILGLGSSARDLQPFQDDARITWMLGLPAFGAADVVLIFGGDGTVHRHLAPLVGLGLPILVVPCGSGNDFARGLGIRGVSDALGVWHQFKSGVGATKAIDLGIITPWPVATAFRSLETMRGSASKPSAKHYFCCVAGVGLDGEVTHRANRLPRWLRGHGGYALTLPIALLGFTPRRITISEPCCDNTSNVVQRFSGRALLAAFANGPVYGGGMHIAPRAQMDDGLLDICLVGNLGKLKLLSLFPTVYAGRHLAIRQVEYFQAKSVRVETEAPMHIYADGEYVCETPVEVSTAPGALKVIAAPTS